MVLILVLDELLERKATLDIRVPLDRRVNENLRLPNEPLNGALEFTVVYHAQEACYLASALLTLKIRKKFSTKTRTKWQPDHQVIMASTPYTLRV